MGGEGTTLLIVRIWQDGFCYKYAFTTLSISTGPHQASNRLKYGFKTTACSRSRILLKVAESASQASDLPAWVMMV